MKLLWALISCGLVCLSLTAADSAGKIRVLVVTGGHDFEKEPFFQVFKDNSEIEYQAVEQPAAQESFKVDAAKNYDVLVFYDMHQEITDEGKSNLLARLKDGKGLVVLHHAIADYQTWPEYAKIIGAKYYLAPTVEAIRSASVSATGSDRGIPILLGTVAFHLYDHNPRKNEVSCRETVSWLDSLLEYRVRGRFAK